MRILKHIPQLILAVAGLGALTFWLLPFLATEIYRDYLSNRAGIFFISATLFFLIGHHYGQRYRRFKHR